MSNTTARSDSGPASATRSQKGRLAIKAARDHNDRAPASKLPNEILAKVFLVHAASLSVRYKGAGEAQLPFQVVVSHVCQRWRDVAVSTAALWTRFRVDKHMQHEALDQWMARSQQALLHLNIEYDSWLSKAPPTYLKKTLKQLPRIYSLQSSLSAIQLEQYFSMEKLPITALKTLELRRPMDFLCMAADGPVFLKTLADKFPQLCAFHISGYQLDEWTLPSTLTVLSVGIPSAYMKIPLDKILNTLQGLPLLQELSLQYVCLESAESDTPGTVLQQVSLLHLRKLSIHGDSGSELYLLDQLTFPPLQRLHLQLRVGRFSDLLHHPKLFQAGLIADIQFRSLALCLPSSVYSYAHFELCAWHLPRSLKHSDFRASPSLQNEDVRIFIAAPLLSHHNVYDDGGSIMANLLNNLPFSEVEILSLECDFGQMLHSNTFWNLRKVHTLGLYVDCYDDQDRSIAYLMELLEHPTIVFPKLYTLYLQCVRFRRDTPIFSHTLSQRQQKAPIAQLVLRGCDDITPEDITMMTVGRPFTGIYVDWDKKNSKDLARERTAGWAEKKR